MMEIILLCKVQLLNLFQINKALHEKSIAGKIKLFGLFFLLCIACCCVSVYAYLYSRALGQSFAMIGRPELLLGMMVGMASVFTFFTTIYKAQGTLFAFRDYDLILSLPVSTSHVVVSRLLFLYLPNLIFTAMIMIPSVVVYAGSAHPGALFYLLFILSLPLIPLVPMVLAVLLGCVISLVSARFRHRNLITMLLMTVSMIGLFLLYTKMVALSPDVLADVSAMITDTVYRLYPLSQMYVTGILGQSWLGLLSFVLISCAVFAAFCWVIGRYFKRINTILTASHVSRQYRKGKLTASSPLAALYQKELRRYFSSSLYVFNTAFGFIMLLLLSAALLFFPPQQIMELLSIPQVSQSLADLAPFAVALLIGMGCTTCCAISLEGSQLWILQSSPAGLRDIFLSKILVNLTLSLPTIAVCVPCLMFVLRPTGIQTLFLWVMPVLYALMIAVWGLYCNLLFPNLTWTTEMTAIKQSAAAFVAVLSSMILGAVPLFCAVQFARLGIPLLSAVTCGVVAFLTLACLWLLMTDGKRRFLKL